MSGRGDLSFTFDVQGKSSLEIGDSKLLWKKTPPPAESEKYYNFSRFACELNELEEGVCPTDSRLRPDQRLMEEGRWDEANTEKVRLEEKQRAVRRQREAEQELASQEGREYTGQSVSPLLYFILFCRDLVLNNTLFQPRDPSGSSKLPTLTRRGR